MSKKQRKSAKNYTGWLLFLAVLAGAGYLWIKQQLGLIEFGNASIPFQKLEGGAIKLGIVIPIINASSLAANVTGFAGVIKSPDGGVIGTVFLAEPASVRRYEQADLKFTAMIKLTDIAAEAFDILKNDGKVDWKGYIVKGQVRVYGFPIPLEVPLF
jgi:hypothetical protein